MLLLRGSNRLFAPIEIRGLMFLACILAIAGFAKADDLSDRREAAAQRLANEIARSAVHRIYVPDFTDVSGEHVVLGRFLAATFSTLLHDNAKGFAVANRIDAHRYLAESGRTDRDLSAIEALAKLVSDLGADAILWGTVWVNQDAVTIDFSLRDTSGKELLKSRYEENFNVSDRDEFEADRSDSYFAGLDGVTVPKCLYCPVPPYPIGQGSPKHDGVVHLYVLVTIEGKAAEIRVTKSLDPAFDRAAIEGVRSWRFEPAKDPDGKVIPVRMPIEVTYKQRWRPYP